MEDLTLDIGGEGRHLSAWNINPSRTVTLGPNRGRTIPRLIRARADALPFPADTVRQVIVERTPLTRAAVREIARVIRPDGRVILRHVPLPHGDRHQAAVGILGGLVRRTSATLHGQSVMETIIDVGDKSSPPEAVRNDTGPHD